MNIITVKIQLSVLNDNYETKFIHPKTIELKYVSLNVHTQRSFIDREGSNSGDIAGRQDSFIYLISFPSYILTLKIKVSSQ